MIAAFIFWIFFSGVAAVIASGKGRSGPGFFLLSVLLSPLIGVVAALVASPNPEAVESRQLETGLRRKCPYCAEIIKRDAIVCRFCGKDVAHETQRQFDETGAELGEVCWSYTKLRTAPSATGSILDQLPQGTSLLITSRSKGYAQVRVPDRNLEGWVLQSSVGVKPPN